MTKLRNFNFRQTKSERGARSAYSNFRRMISHHVNKVILKKYGKS